MEEKVFSATVQQILSLRKQARSTGQSVCFCGIYESDVRLWSYGYSSMDGEDKGLDAQSRDRYSDLNLKVFNQWGL
jgi:hypothetical protein